ncbi:hypothetical protein [Pseudomonas juntendi]|uniref:hypothetical protein n=1 Tax=Pseudomonas juntendi TaxID=2666183 RepID=UPI003AFB4C70
MPINNHAELYFKLSDGTNIVVAANSTTGSDHGYRAGQRLRRRQRASGQRY